MMKIKTLNIIMVIIGILIFVVGVYQKDSIICLFGITGMIIGKKKEKEEESEEDES